MICIEIRGKPALHKRGRAASPRHSRAYAAVGTALLLLIMQPAHAQDIQLFRSGRPRNAEVQKRQSTDGEGTPTIPLRMVLPDKRELARLARRSPAGQTRFLFVGSSGTGKKMTASALAEELKMNLYRVDLSTVVSKFIGETEKNLATLFDRAEHRNWILFFDEADALFGERTEGKDARDRYAESETASYLLQRIKTHRGIVILGVRQRERAVEAASRHFSFTGEVQF